MQLIKSANFAFAVATLLTTALLFSFFALEPQVSRAQVDSNAFTITQTIDGAISFTVQPSNVSMVGSIDGLSGGNATGTTFAVVRSNSASGYTLDIKFSTSGPAMRGNVTGNTGLLDYTATQTPDYTFSPDGSARFFYTANSSSTLDGNFLDNGATCGSGSYTANRCWAGPNDTTLRLVDHGSSTPNGATTTLTFRVYVPNSPNPTLDADTYTATATLTATNK